MGVQLKSNSPFSCAYANSLGFNLDECRRLIVISDCSRRRSQLCIGKSGSVTQIPARKWYLKFLMARSAALRLCMPGGASW